MSFVTAVRDYVDFINQSYDSMSTHGNLLFLFQHTLLYLLESCKYGFLLSAEPSMGDGPPFLANLGAINVGGDPTREFLSSREPTSERLSSSRVTFFFGEQILCWIFKQPFHLSSDVGHTSPCWKTAFGGRHPSRAGSRAGKHCWSLLLPCCHSVWMEGGGPPVAFLGTFHLFSGSHCPAADGLHDLPRAFGQGRGLLGKGKTPSIFSDQSLFDMV